MHGPRPRVWLWWPGMRLLRSLSNSMEAMETLSPSMPALASPKHARLGSVYSRDLRIFCAATMGTKYRCFFQRVPVESHSLLPTC